MRIDLPDPSLVVLIGASGSGKSSFARRHFAPKLWAPYHSGHALFRQVAIA